MCAHNLALSKRKIHKETLENLRKCAPFEILSSEVSEKSTLKIDEKRDEVERHCHNQVDDL